MKPAAAGKADDETGRELHRGQGIGSGIEG